MYTHGTLTVCNKTIWMEELNFRNVEHGEETIKEQQHDKRWSHFTLKREKKTLPAATTAAERKKLHTMLFCYCEAPSLHILLSLARWVKWEQIRLDIIFSGHFVFLARAISIVIHCDRLQATKLIEMCSALSAWRFFFIAMKRKEVGYWRFRWPACNSTLFDVHCCSAFGVACILCSLGSKSNEA